MNLLVTAGGTSEKIDEVRKITNTGTGRLGSLVAEEFLQEADAGVTYVCSENAVLPRDKRAEIIRVDSVRNLKQTLEDLMRERPFDAVVHSMAVSDYSLQYSAPSDELADFLAEQLYQNREAAGSRARLSAEIKQKLSEYAPQCHPQKISSDIDHLFLSLEKTPKVIRLFKELQPETVLVGFKLLSGAEESSLLLAAKKLMETNRCDFVLANDAENIGENRHSGILVGADGTMCRLHSKSEIARAIAAGAMKKIREKRQK